MTAPERSAAPKPTWFAKNRTTVLISLGIVALVVVAGIIGASSPPPSWGLTSQQVGHPLVVLIDPANTQALYVGTEAGTIERSSDNGASWADLSKGLPAQIAVSALLKSADGTHFLAGTSAGVVIFNAATNTWATSNTGLPAGDGIDALAFGSVDAMTVLAGSETNGLYRSTDGGKTWAASSGLPAHADIYGLTTTTDGKTLYAALIGGGVYRSTDAGATWATLNTGLPDKVDVFSIVARPASTKLASGPSRLANLFAGTNQGIYRSDDQGTHWVASSTGLGTTRAISLSVDPLESLFLLAGTDAGVYKSTDGGSHWSTLANGIPSGQHVGIVLISHPKANTEMLFAAADQFYHYPGQNGSITGTISRVLIFGTLIGAFIWVSLRQRRTLQAMTPAVRPPAPKTLTNRAGAPRPSMRTGTTSHIRGGPPPRPPVNNTDAEGEA